MDQKAGAPGIPGGGVRLKDSKEMQEIEEGLSSWDEMVSFDNFKTYYLLNKKI